MDTPKISKLLRLMKLLTGNVSRTIREAGRWVLRTTVQALEGVGAEDIKRYYRPRNHFQAGTM